MGGEMIFIHEHKPIENLEAYWKLLKEIAFDCNIPKRLRAAATDDDIKHLKLQLIKTPISNWNDGYITRHAYEKIGQDDDYVLSVDLGRSTRNPDNNYFVIFPRDPNKFKIISDTHARGLDYYSKKWIHDYFVKFVVTFPGVFKLYYGDGFGGYGDDYSGFYQIVYRDGSAVPVECRNILEA